MGEQGAHRLSFTGLHGAGAWWEARVARRLGTEEGWVVPVCCWLPSRIFGLDCGLGTVQGEGWGTGWGCREGVVQGGKGQVGTRLWFTWREGGLWAEGSVPYPSPQNHIFQNNCMDTVFTRGEEITPPRPEQQLILQGPQKGIQDYFFITPWGRYAKDLGEVLGKPIKQHNKCAVLGSLPGEKPLS